MPGIVMDDASVNESRHWMNARDVSESNGAQDSATRAENNGALQGLEKTSRYLNGSKDPESSHRTPDMPTEQQQDLYCLNPSQKQIQPPPHLLHITHGFFPYSQLVNRAVQQCWNELSDLITELAEVQIPTQSQQSSPMALMNGKASSNQSAENVQKKLRILEFAHAKRTEFIKLLVLSQWSRQAGDVSKLIDLQSFIRTRHMAYNATIQRVADMKRDLVRAQIANPDLKTALEVLSTGHVSNMPDVSICLLLLIHSHAYMLGLSLDIDLPDLSLRRLFYEPYEGSIASLAHGSYYMIPSRLHSTIIVSTMVG
jgi:mediator of RNA polymerase II transcription subunit 14